MASKKKSRLSSVDSNFKVEMEDVNVEGDAALIGRSLFNCWEIVLQHEKVWSKKRSGETSRRLRSAITFLQSLILLVSHLDNYERYFRMAVFDLEVNDILTCIRAFKGATKEDQNLVIEHRNQIRFHLLAFFSSFRSFRCIRWRRT
uniref:Uncharacterized protein n=1 Tax=Paramoeba aestuarina TaxID=180227 RepID=A0A7S4NPA7_9EUKA